MHGTPLISQYNSSYIILLIIKTLTSHLPFPDQVKSLHSHDYGLLLHAEHSLGFRSEAHAINPAVSPASCSSEALLLSMF